MDFNLSKQQELIRQLMHDFAENEVKPLAAEIDDTEQFPVETVRKIAAQEGAQVVVICAEIEAEMNKATSTPVLGKPATPNVTEKTGTASDTYKKAFWNSVRNRNWIDVHDDLHIGTDAEGGYLVPDEFERKLVEALEEESIFRQMATVIKTSNGDRKIPIVTSKGEAVWMDEEQQYSLSDDRTKLGRPEGFNIHVRDAFVNAGAGFVVILTGAIMTMPGLPKKPAAFGIDVDDNGKITGLF